MDPSTHDRPRSIEQFTTQWWFAGLTAMAGAFAGLLGSVFSGEIKSAFPFVLQNGPIEWVAVLFWSALGVFGAMFGLNFRGQAQTAELQIDRLHEETRVLERLLRTLPPENFLERFETVLEATYISVLECKQKSDDPKQLLINAIKANLGAIAALAKMFDGDHEGVIYSANVMMYVPVNSLTDAELSTYQGRIRFLGEEHLNLRDALSGLLVLDPRFAMSVKSGELKEDTAMIEVILPVPSPDRRSYAKQSGVLPGAPEAFLHPDGLSGYADTASLANFCRDQRPFHPRVAEELETYFETAPGDQIKSFFSISIPSAEELCIGSSCEPMGVLNMHSNKTNILGEKEVSMFLPLVRPFVLWIATLLAELEAIQATNSSNSAQGV